MDSKSMPLLFIGIHTEFADSTFTSATTTMSSTKERKVFNFCLLTCISLSENGDQTIAHLSNLAYFKSSISEQSLWFKDFRKPLEHPTLTNYFPLIYHFSCLTAHSWWLNPHQNDGKSTSATSRARQGAGCAATQAEHARCMREPEILEAGNSLSSWILYIYDYKLLYIDYKYIYIYICVCVSADVCCVCIYVVYP